jgi:hypothetical protein
MTKTLHNEIAFRQFAAEMGFFKFTKRYVLHARDLAKAGQKDAARDWHRYFSGAQVAKILRPNGVITESNIAELAQEIVLLGGECHPLDVPQFQTDLESIREGIETLLARTTPKVRSRSSNSLGDRAMRRMNI